MDEELLKAYCRSAYRVRLAGGGAATIRIGEPLPVVLRPLAGNRDWGFFTAWNPRSRPLSPIDNRDAQRRLLADLRADASLETHPALGKGTDGWREPSFWIVGIGPDALERLANRYGQNAWLFGHGAGTAELRLR
ncbi:DUF3293 domain-containing protein [Frateuria sp. STR12]|uniref:DUF3293 domain-containing protein n=1 Tax=Frateuria hangzhouensis TaxID=2995589 RepID=UPI002260B779|nr:DUF3293 domain-containing protein [Frateuria sp. STR12]MCX7512232.1 DUF3293 domain-containing protein [Frateuria sp. STR12]